MTRSLTALSDAGVSIWLDDLSRTRLTSGSLAELVAHDRVSGVTTNPSIFAKAISGTADYDAQLRDLAVRGIGAGEALRALTTYDVRWACDILRPVYEKTDGVDGRVSIEVDPRLAHDTAATIAEAKALWWAVDRPNLFVKIPAALQGLEAITACLAEGISINITLIFSLTRYGEVMDAFLDGLEQAHQNGHDLAVIGSVASFFVSRVDSAIDEQLDKIGTSEAAALRGQAAIANARLAYQRYERVFSSPRWKALASFGAHAQRPLWASTSTKDPAYSDTRYVVDLVAPGVVNTMPEATLRAVADHATVPADSVHDHYAHAQRVLDGLGALGIDYDTVVQELEDEGVAKFEQAWDQLGKQLATTLRTTRIQRASSVSMARVYDEPARGEGTRVLVDRLWPRGLSKENAHVGTWCKEVAPSTELRKWYGHDPARFAEFSGRYRAELQEPDRAAALRHLQALARSHTLTLVTATKTIEISQAAVLADVLQRSLGETE